MKLMNDRKQIMIRVPHELAKKYLAQAENEGFGSLTAWIVSVLNQSLSANKKLTEGQIEVSNVR